MKSLKRTMQFFVPKDWLVIFALSGLIITSCLGNWQILRAREKEGILQSYKDSTQSAFIHWKTEHKNPEQFENVLIKGSYLPDKLFLDNQFYQHQPGYDVITPFLIENQIVLVDRGWVKAPSDRDHYPVVSLPSKVKLIKGQVYYPSKKPFLLGAAIEKKDQDILLLEQLDTDLLSKLLHKPVYPFIIRLNKMQQHGFIRDWPVISMPPARHYAYALQWFCMSLGLFIFSIYRQIKRQDEK